MFLNFLIHNIIFFSVKEQVMRMTPAEVFKEFDSKMALLQNKTPEMDEVGVEKLGACANACLERLGKYYQKLILK